MTYDFDKIIERRGTNCSKWDTDPSTIEGVHYPVSNPLPLWIADMDFAVAPEITQALVERARHGVFGYPIVPDSCYEAIIEWEEKRHGWKIERDWILFSPGAVPAAHMAVQAYCQPGDKTILQQPVYYPFFRTIYNNGGLVVNNALSLEGERYEMDFDLLERQAADPRASFFILCSPHNPVGRVWSASDLERVGDICARHGLLVFADELHCDIIMPGHKHVPFASLNDACRDNSITVIAPSKTFNLAGLQATVVIIPNPRLRQRFENVLSQNSISKPNLFAITGLEAAYRHGEKWLDELLVYIKGNYDFLVQTLKERLPQVKVLPLEGTFLAWADFSALEPDPEKLQRRMLTEAEVWLDEGYIFGSEGAGFERIVLACPRAILKEAIDRIVRTFG
ncbi:MAG: pyridoxal phosphate-dependent aminotransferase [Fretibacterium sp.]|nr:pyridoxal phosphate-dependent aminotransferase [Fretibacterium sp.]